MPFRSNTPTMGRGVTQVLRAPEVLDLSILVRFQCPPHDTLQQRVGFDLKTKSSEKSISGSFLNAFWSTSV